MNEPPENPEQYQDPLKPAADHLLSYIHNLIYKPSSASLDIESLPDAFGDFGRELLQLGKIISETKVLAKELAFGNLQCTLPPPGNEFASPLKMLHSSLKHLTWQTQQVAKGDYKQRVNFMGDFSIAFNNMVGQLEQNHKIIMDEKTRLEMYVQLILVNCPNPILLFNSRDELTYVSDSYFRHNKNCGKDDILGKEIDELFEPIVCGKSLSEIMGIYKKAILEKRMYMTEQKIDFGDSEYSGHYEIQIAPMMDTGTFEGIIVFLFNITENVKARLNAENARELSEKSSRSKSDFLTKMSDDIRTPMNTIIDTAELALRENKSPETENHILAIKEAGITLSSILNFSKTV